MRPTQAILAVLLLGALTARAAEGVSFGKDIAPILVAKCQACHNAEKAKGSYRLHTFAALNQPGASKEAPIMPGQPESSLLYKLLVATREEDRMPQKDEALPASSLRLIRTWIEQGARFDGTNANAPLARLAPPAHAAAPKTYTRPLPITALAFHPSGELLAASGYHEVTVWEARTGILRARLGSLAERTFDLAYSPEGAWLACASGTPGRIGELKLLPTTNGPEPRLLHTSPDAVLCLAFSPDGRRLAAGGSDSAMRIWDVASGRLETTIEQHADWILDLAFSPDGRHLVSASRDKSARVFTVPEGELEETYPGQVDFITAVVWADATSILSASRNRTIHRWTVKEARRTAEFRGWEEDVTGLILNGGEFFAGSLDGSLREYGLAKKQLKRTLVESGPAIQALAWHPGSGHLASGHQQGEVQIWQAGKGALVTRFIAAPGHTSGLSKSK